MTDPALPAVRALFQSERNAILCTLHADHDGWPYGSIAPYAVLPDGDLVVFLSDISEHAKNLQADDRVTVFLADPAVREAPQTGARHAMMARARRPNGDEEATAEACYFARFPEAERMRSAHGFDVWILSCQRIRWIAGFGGMGWLDRDAWDSQ